VESVPNEVDEIRRQMAKIRIDLHYDMRSVVAGAEAATDWRFYVRHYPWVCLGVAFASGFLAVPRRRRSIHATAEAAATAAVEKVQHHAPDQTFAIVPAAPRTSWLFRLVKTHVVPLALRSAQAYAAQYIENILIRQNAGGPEREVDPADKASQARRF
jgi:hypothetical protein